MDMPHLPGDVASADFAYEFTLDVAGRTFLVRREFGLIRKIEARFGAIDPLARRLEAAAVTQMELIDLYGLLLDGQDGKPSRADLGAWVFETGTHIVAKPLAFQLLHLVMGNDLLRAMAARRPRRDVPEDESGGPFVPTAASTGLTS